MNKKKFLSFAICVGILFASVPAEAASSVKVKRGDTLSKISHHYHISVAKLKSLNHLKGSRIYIGQTLRLTSPTTPTVKTKSVKKTSATKTYKVKRGDSLSLIGKRYHVSVSNLKKWNHLHSSKILIGQKLVVSKPSVAAPTKPAAPTKIQAPIKPLNPTQTSVSSPVSSPAVLTGTTTDSETTSSQKPSTGASSTPTVNQSIDQLSAPSTANQSGGQSFEAFDPANGAATGSTPSALPTVTSGASSDTSTTGQQTSPISGQTDSATTPAAPTPPSPSTTVAPAATTPPTPSTSIGSSTQTSGTSGTAAPPQPAKPPTVKSNGKVILLDPGHGGKDSGAIVHGVKEVDINWAMGQKVKTELVKRGYKVILSHSSPTTSCLTSYKSTHYELQCRLNKGYANHANLYLSLHANAMPYSSQTSVNGLEVHYNSKATRGFPQVNGQPAKSKRLATLLDQAVPAAMKEKNLGLINDSLYVTRMAKIPSVLIEMGYLTNQSDTAKLKSATYQQRSAVAIANALDLYFKEGN